MNKYKKYLTLRKESDSVKNFMVDLRKLEQQILVNGGNVYNQNTRRILLSVIKYVEKADFTTSIHTKFICENFRLTLQQLQIRWNQLHNENKSESAFRSQSSTVSRQLFSIFGSDLINIFLTEDEEGLCVIARLLEALTDCPDNIKDYFSGVILEQIEDIEWEKSFTTEELIPVIDAISPFVKDNILEVMENLDKQKLSYLFHILRQPLTSNRTRKTNMQKVEILLQLKNKNNKQENSQDDGFIKRLRMAGEVNNDYPNSQENREYLRRMINAYSEQGLQRMLQTKKISSYDIRTVLYELDSRIK